MENRGSADESFENSGHSENWERFMLLWSAAPEVFIGSCLISVLAILGTIILSRFTNSDSTSLMRMEDDKGQNEKVDKPLRSRIPKSSRFSVKQKRTEIQPGYDEVSTKFKSKYARAAEKLKAHLTSEELTEEKQVQQRQLKGIFELMKSQSEKFGISDVNQVEEQMKLYM